MDSPTLYVTFDSVKGQLSAIGRLQEMKILADFDICSFIENKVLQFINYFNNFPSKHKFCVLKRNISAKRFFKAPKTSVLIGNIENA